MSVSISDCLVFMSDLFRHKNRGEENLILVGRFKLGAIAVVRLMDQVRAGVPRVRARLSRV